LGSDFWPRFFIGKNAYFVYFEQMQATLTELRRQTGKVIRAAERGVEVVLTEHGEARLTLTAIKPVNRKAAAAALKAIGPVEFLPRQ
jgi:antitoxin (DNA-binding transcriptional repressor) of toxin-antitoxin stability system